MLGEFVPLTLLPRFTSYVGPGVYLTAPMNVADVQDGFLTFWRGPLVGGAASDPFKAYFDQSHDAFEWSPAGSTPSQPITAVNTASVCEIGFTKRWFRVRVELAADAGGVVAISLWLAGSASRRVE